MCVCGEGGVNTIFDSFSFWSLLFPLILVQKMKNLSNFSFYRHLTNENYLSGKQRAQLAH